MLIAIMLAAGGLAGAGVWNGSDDPVFVVPAAGVMSMMEDPPLPGGLEWEPNASASTIPGHECKEFSQCPKGAAYKDPSGNVKGCELPPGTPGPTNPCTGTCTVCEGNGSTVYLCSLKALSSCEIPGGSASGQACGNRATSTCGWAGANQGVNGCSCAIPAGFPGDPCTFLACSE